MNKKRIFKTAITHDVSCDKIRSKFLKPHIPQALRLWGTQTITILVSSLPLKYS